MVVLFYLVVKIIINNSLFWPNVEYRLLPRHATRPDPHPDLPLLLLLDIPTS